MHLLYLNYFYDKDIITPIELLDRYHSMTHWCEAVKSAGLEKISVVQRFHHSLLVERNKIQYHFVSDHLSNDVQWWQIPLKVHRLIALLKPDVIHSNGKIFPLYWLRKHLKYRYNILWQYHGGIPQTHWKRGLLKFGYRSVDGFIFTAAAQAEMYRKDGFILENQRVFEITENSTYLSPQSQCDSQRQLNIKGEPVFLWVGRLNTNKDPLTVITGFSKIAGEYKNAKLYMIFSEGDLLNEVRLLISSLKMNSHICLIGKIAHELIHQYYSAADYFILGSHHEGAGYALIEAIACGVTPIITDIPSFQSITRNASIGIQWKKGNPEDLARSIRSITARPTNRDLIRAHFDRYLQFSVLGEQACKIYREAINNS